MTANTVKQCDLSKLNKTEICSIPFESWTGSINSFGQFPQKEPTQKISIFSKFVIF